MKKQLGSPGLMILLTAGLLVPLCAGTQATARAADDDGDSAVQAAANSGADPDPDYDRLDGHGKSGKTIQVIEWEGNLEIHSYPAGALKGLAMKLDDRERGKLVMVIGYRFNDNPSVQYIRRAILGVPFRAGFQAYRDPSAAADGYDKIIVTNNKMASPLSGYRLEAAPKQLYPDGHPALEDGGHSGEGGPKRGNAAPNPAPDAPGKKSAPAAVKRVPSNAAAEMSGENSVDEESGTIQPFFSGKRK